MIGFLTDSNNDLFLDNLGNISTGAELDAIKQQILNRIRLQQGEYQYDLTRGVNYMGYMLTDSPNLRLWENQIFDIVRSVEGVNKITFWATEMAGNVFQFAMKLDTIYGELEIKG